MLKTASALLAVCASLAVAAPASADSIAYVKDGDVWLSTSDGSRQQQVTRTGEYSYVSQADDGTMAALVGENIRKLSRTGEVLADFPTYVSDGPGQSGPVSQFHGPFNPEISRDGTKVAFEWINNTYTSGNDSSCSSTSVPACHELVSRQGVGITHSDRMTGIEEFGLLTGWMGPYWMSDSRLLRSDANIAYNVDTVINEIGPGKGDDEMKQWFWDEIDAQGGVGEVEITRDGRFAAGIEGWGEEVLRVYRVLSDPMSAPEQSIFDPEGNPEVVEPCVFFTDPVGGSFGGLSFAPDGRNLAYDVGDGIWITEVPDISGGCGPLPAANRLVIPGGHHPHWGPADVPPASAFEPKQPEQPQDPQQPVTPTASLSVAKGAAKRTVKVTTPAAGRITVVARKGARRVARGTKTVAAAGTHTIRLRVAKRARLGRVRLTVTFRPVGGQSQRKVVALRLAG
ncbi:MAG TPA: hypothetical protein VF587_13630 [Solirubrobacteraceae bacterium]